MSDDARKLLQDIEEYLNFSSQDSYYAEWLREVKLRITALLSAPAPEPVWIQSNHLQNAMQAPFLCRVEPTKRDGFIPLYTHPPASSWVRCEDVGGLPLIIAGALYDFGGFLTTRENIMRVGSTENASPMVDAIKEFAALRKLPLDDAAVQSWQDPLPPLPEDKQ